MPRSPVLLFSSCALAHRSCPPAGGRLVPAPLRCAGENNVCRAYDARMENTENRDQRVRIENVGE